MIELRTKRQKQPWKKLVCFCFSLWANNNNTKTTTTTTTTKQQQQQHQNNNNNNNNNNKQNNNTTTTTTKQQQQKQQIKQQQHNNKNNNKNNFLGPKRAPPKNWPKKGQEDHVFKPSRAQVYDLLFFKPNKGRSCV